MLAQPFGVDQLQTGVRNAADHAAHVRQFASRKYVFLDEVADAAAEMRAVEPVVRDAVVQHESAGFEDLIDLAEVTAEVSDADMLEHADARDLVVLHVVGEIEIIAQLHAHTILESSRCDLRDNEVALISGKRDAGRLDAVVLRSPEDQTAPAATDVQQRLAGR